MRSGTGRHRRPRQAPAFIVAAGVTGAGMAMPLLTAASASAVSDDAWDRAAECESGGRWSANEGNGMYGGFQLTLEQWEAYGGLEFATRPDLASRAQQISVAERLLADMRMAALPGCGVASGVWHEYRQERREEIDRAEEAEEAQAEEEIGASPEESSAEAGAEDRPGDVAPEPEPVEETPDAGDRPTEEPAEGATGGGARNEGATDDADELPEAEGSGRHRGDPDPAETGTTERDAQRDSGRAGAERGDRDGGRERASNGEYRVLPGDTLSHIALEQGVSGGWPALYQANESVIGDDPDYILPGQQLDLSPVGR
ncbi:transglycosylase family protein [Streptomyces sp. NBRC 109706]|uniref:LysM peptidoglycan-binding domain-containing protein n=1 Tax=Streptomyces sp. NBRC 109706 TaxID=1550035 RepID=UPI00082F033C|nr:transglycosylase family protein [Streptomyces sp. NBRC 109706]